MYENWSEDLLLPLSTNVIYFFFKLHKAKVNWLVALLGVLSMNLSIGFAFADWHGGRRTKSRLGSGLVSQLIQFFAMLTCATATNAASEKSHKCNRSTNSMWHGSIGQRVLGWDAAVNRLTRAKFISQWERVNYTKTKKECSIIYWNEMSGWVGD